MHLSCFLKQGVKKKSHGTEKLFFYFKPKYKANFLKKAYFTKFKK